MTDEGLYVYGIVSAGAITAAPALPGVDGAHMVECLSHLGVRALVSRIDLEQFDEQPLREHLSDMDWVERTARAHQRVLEAVLDTTTPIPMRLCTVYRDEDGLRQMLDLEQAELTAVLDELSGKLEWGVQVFAPGRAATAAQAQARVQDQSGGPESGTAYLRGRLAARDAGEQLNADLEGICHQLHAQLCVLSSDSRLGVPQSREASAREAPMLLNAFHLVDNERRDAFCALARELGGQLAEQGIELRLTGPWAPYNFVATAAGLV